MATPNYSYEKRQRELAKKRKTEEKRQKKQHVRGVDEPGANDGNSVNAPAETTGEPGATPPPAG